MSDFEINNCFFSFGNMVIMDIYVRFLNNSFLFSLGDMVIMDMPVWLLTPNQQI